MSFEMAEKIARAVLYEGYMLYPYRPSSLKNQQRWNFGTLYPSAYEEVRRGTERSSIHVECLLRGSPGSRLDVLVRFLRFAGEKGISGWSEASERSSEYRFQIIDGKQQVAFGEVDGTRGSIGFTAQAIDPSLLKLCIDLVNDSELDSSATRKEALDKSLISAHLILHAGQGGFLSLLDPPEDARGAVAECKNTGCFPVLVGDPGQHNLLLCSPIILYDYPQIAPESAGDFFDGTEMDEMLTLRVMTMTEEEKHEIRANDDRARNLLERTERTAREQLMRTHGTFRGTNREMQMNSERNPLEPESTRRHSVTAFGVEVRVGDRVRIWPHKSADIMDMALQGKIAVVEAIEVDFEDQIHLAVVLEDDPGRDLGLLRQPGHRFFYSIHEVEPLRSKREAS